MHLLIILLPLASVLQQSLGTDNNPPVGKITEKQKKEILDKHNAIRRGVKPTASNMLKMEWSEKASESARKWAVKCIASSSPREERIVDGVACGESTLKSTYPLSWIEVITKWFSKASNFRYGYGAVNPRKDFYSYTQLIWYNTHEVGCGLAYCPQNEYTYFYICRYCPAGNVRGEELTPYRKGPPCGDCPSNCEDRLCSKLLTS
ncbi:cysteine-rich venom protein 2-like [Tiliqua scincoides]|uniref:cysteine-rich venom protein 2-like n=1 Tax=Tiliqua scincoides TaxID=71010 RepID=UPI00346284E0